MRRSAGGLILLWCVLVSTAAWAATIDLPNGYVKFLNYEGAWSGYYGGLPGDPSSGITAGFSTWTSGWAWTNTSAITPSIRNKIASLPPSDNPLENFLHFQLGGEAVVDESLAWQSTDLRLGGQQYSHVKFDWATYIPSFTAPQCLQLQIPGQSAPIWSISLKPGYRNGHVDMAIVDAYVMDICFMLRVVTPVPEPSAGAVVLVGLCGLAASHRKKRSLKK